MTEKSMAREAYRYVFARGVPEEEVDATILLAIWGAESLHGEAQVRLDLTHRFDPSRRVCVVDASTPVGRDFNRLLLGYLQREFGADAFVVCRASTPKRREAKRV